MSSTTEEKGPAPTLSIDGGVGKRESVASAATVLIPPPIINNAEKPISKKQMKREHRWGKALERKRRRKQQEKEVKIARALSQGRDLDKERELMAERTKSGEGHQRREERWLRRMKSADTTFQVCVDCGFNDEMTEKELNSLASQIRYCYSANRKSHNPVYFSVSSLGGVVQEKLSKVEGFPDQWAKRAFSCSVKSLRDMHPDLSKLVYLTSDSQNTLEHLEDDKIYVIGGIVDRNRLKRAAINKAESLGVQTAKLPITDHLELVSTKVLTCNHVFEILLQYREKGNDWKKAMLAVLPNRKEALAKENPVSITTRKGASATVVDATVTKPTTDASAQAASTEL